MTDTRDDAREAASYDYLDTLTETQAAFEYLRRNPLYRRSYRALAAGGVADSVPAPPEFTESWGLRFCGGPGPARRRRRRRLVLAPRSVAGDPRRRAA